MTLTAKPSISEPYVVRRDAGLIDLWWPFYPAPVVGRYSMKVTGRETEGRLFQMLITDGQGAASPLHLHHDADESFFVIDGEIAFFVGDQQIEARAGDFVFGPRGVPHAFLVRSERAEFLITFAPAGLEGFFAEVAVPVVAGEPVPEPVAPDPEEFTRKMAAYSVEVVGPSPTLD